MIKQRKIKIDVVAQACNPSTQEVEGRSQEFMVILSYVLTLPYVYEYFD